LNAEGIHIAAPGLAPFVYLTGKNSGNLTQAARDVWCLARELPSSGRGNFSVLRREEAVHLLPGERYQFYPCLDATRVLSTGEKAGYRLAWQYSNE